MHFSEGCRSRLQGLRFLVQSSPLKSPFCCLRANQALALTALARARSRSARSLFNSATIGGTQGLLFKSVVIVNAPPSYRMNAFTKEFTVRVGISRSQSSALSRNNFCGMRFSSQSSRSTFKSPFCNGAPASRKRIISFRHSSPWSSVVDSPFHPGSLRHPTSLHALVKGPGAICQAFASWRSR
jgi:hypothetical protein